MPRPPEQGDYIVNSRTFFQENYADYPSEKRQELDDRLSRISKWPWSAEDEPELAAWIRRNEKPLAVIAEAAKRPRYFNPLVSRRKQEWSAGLMGALLPTVQQCRMVAALLASRAMLRTHEGKYDDAWQDLMTCHRLGRLMSQCRTLIESLVAMAIDRISSDAELSYLSNAKQSPEQLAGRLRDFQALPPMQGIASAIEYGERFLLLDFATNMVRHGETGLSGVETALGQRPSKKEITSKWFTRSINWDPALAQCNRFYDRCAAASRLPDYASRQAEFARISDDLKANKPDGKDLVVMHSIAGPKQRGEIIGKILVGLLAPALEKVQTASDRGEQTQRNLQLAFVLEGYQRESGHYPEKLSDLAPKHLSNIPNDLFNGRPLVYKPTANGYLLYSVGPDGKDNNGRTTDDEPRGDDIRVRMPAVEPQLLR